RPVSSFTLVTPIDPLLSLFPYTTLFRSIYEIRLPRQTWWSSPKMPLSTSKITRPDHLRKSQVRHHRCSLFQQSLIMLSTRLGNAWYPLHFLFYRTCH